MRNCVSLYLSPSSRVHISQSTLDSLNGAYEVEPGNGVDRDDYLKKNNVKTYLIIEKVWDSSIQQNLCFMPTLETVIKYYHTSEIRIGNVLIINFYTIQQV